MLLVAVFGQPGLCLGLPGAFLSPYAALSFLLLLLFPG